MFGSRKKSKQKAPEAPLSGLDPPRLPPISNEYQTVDEALGRVDQKQDEVSVQLDHGQLESSDSQLGRVDPVAIINASDDFKMDSLRKKTPDVLALSGHSDVGNNNEIIPEPPPDYPDLGGEEVDEDAPPLPPPLSSLSKEDPSLNTSLTDVNQSDLNIITSIPSDQNRVSYGSETDVEFDNDTKYSEGRTKSKWKREAKGSLEGFENPVFQEEDGPVPKSKKATKDGLKIQQNQFPGLRKKVSWNETVVYTSDDKTDVVLAGLREESETDEAGSNGVSRNNGLVRTSNNGFKDRREYRRSSEPVKKEKKSEYKWSVCCAVVLISLAMVGIVVLGTMYGIKYANEKSTAEKIDDIKHTFALLASGDSSVFMFTLYRSSADQSQDSATYFLLERESVMPWQSPESVATLVWIKGSPLKVQIFDRRGRVLSKVLGDPVEVRGAQFTLRMTYEDWYASRLQDPDSYALVALMQESDSRSWTDANITQLVSGITSPQLRHNIRMYARPRV